MMGTWGLHRRGLHNGLRHNKEMPHSEAGQVWTLQSDDLNQDLNTNTCVHHKNDGALYIGS